ncbi:hypothetical protein [Staphylococcus epidermidis]|nr:hypothetical protein [Staphylococcus epidermidis]
MDIFLRILNFIFASIPNWLGFPTELIKKRKKGFSKEQIEKEKREKQKNQ